MRSCDKKLSVTLRKIEKNKNTQTDKTCEAPEMTDEPMQDEVVQDEVVQWHGCLKTILSLSPCPLTEGFPSSFSCQPWRSRRPVAARKWSRMVTSFYASAESRPVEWRAHLSPPLTIGILEVSC